MRQYESTKYQKACIVIAGDAMEDWKYLFRELKMRVGVSEVPNRRASITQKTSFIDIHFRASLVRGFAPFHFFFGALIKVVRNDSEHMATRNEGTFCFNVQCSIQIKRVS